MFAGCGVADSDDLPVGSESAALVTGNGHMQNGHMQNGHMQNGHMQNGAALALIGVDLTTMHRLVTLPAAGQDPDLSPTNLVLVRNVKLDKTTLTDGVHSGRWFIGHVVYGTLSDGTTELQQVPIYLEDISPTGDAEILHYQLKAHHQFVPNSGSGCTGACPMIWDYVCGTIQQPLVAGATTRRNGRLVVSVPVQATAVGGQWDYHEGQLGDGRKLIDQGNAAYNTKITFACTNGAIGKCVEAAHYKPWAAAATGGQPLTPPPDSELKCYARTQELVHEACVRMVRADYCGNGVSHTVEGVGIDLWDESRINPAQSEDVWGQEAEWTPNGARCLNDAVMGRTSHDGERVDAYLAKACPQKWRGQANQTPPFTWYDGDCFGRGSVSQHSTFDFVNVPKDGTYRTMSSMNLHDRVYLKNRSMCIDDSKSHPEDKPNPDAKSDICVPPTWPPPIFVP